MKLCVGILFSVLCTVVSLAQNPEWAPKHLEELSVGPHRIPKQLLEILKSDAQTDTGGEPCSGPPDLEHRSSLRFVRLG